MSGDASKATPGELTTRRAGAGAKASQAGRGYSSFVAAAVLLMLGLLAIAGVKSYSDLGIGRAEEQRLLAAIADARERIRALDERIDRIENDPAMLERLAREELGLVREGDVVIVLPEEPEEPQARLSSSAASSAAEP